MLRLLRIEFYDADKLKSKMPYAHPIDTEKDIILVRAEGVFGDGGLISLCRE